MEIIKGQKLKITYQNCIRRGIIHGEVIDVLPDHIRLMIFVAERTVVIINKNSIIEHEII